MERKYLKDLESWLEKPNRKPLVIWGARQVGKSYLVRYLFAEKNFKNSYLYLDFASDEALSNYISKHLKIDEVLLYISTTYNRPINEKTLLIFDEVQECPAALTLMKYFAQERPDIPVIITGSMVRMKLKRQKSKRKKFLFPVGKINQLYMYPLDFSEYLLNRNKVLYLEIRKAYSEKRNLDEGLHEKAIDLLYEYLLLGGMPEAVNTYLEYGDMREARLVLREVYDNYLNDMSLYQASPESIIRTRAVFDNVYSQLNKENKNFKVGDLEHGKRNRSLLSPIDWLTSSFLVYKSSLVKEVVTTPLSPSNESLYRLYLADMGIFSYQSGANAAYFIDGNQRNSLSGLFFENFVAEELVSHGFKLFYWKGKRSHEFEFLLECGDQVYPIHAKKSGGRLLSLSEFRTHNPRSMAIKVYGGRYGYNEVDKVLSLPFYMLFCYLEEQRESII